MYRPGTWEVIGEQSAFQRPHREQGIGLHSLPWGQTGFDCSPERAQRRFLESLLLDVVSHRCVDELR